MRPIITENTALFIVNVKEEKVSTKNSILQDWTEWWLGQYTFCWKIFQICGRAGIFVGYIEDILMYFSNKLQAGDGLAQPTSIIMYPSDTGRIKGRFCPISSDVADTAQSLEDHNIPPLSSSPHFSLEKAGTNSSHKNSHYFCPTIIGIMVSVYCQYLIYLM